METSPSTRSRLLRNFAIARRSDQAAANELAAYWQSKRGARLVPARKDIDPLEIPRHLIPHLFMFDVLGGGDDFRYRLIGTDIVDGVGRDSTGAVISQLYREAPDSVAALNQVLRQTMTEKTPLFVSGQMIWFHRVETEKRFNAVFLPLSADNAAIDIIMGGLWTEAA